MFLFSDFLGVSVGYIQQGMTGAQRRAAYASDVTYPTANEIGFDFLRDRLALDPGEGQDRVMRGLERHRRQDRRRHSALLS